MARALPIWTRCAAAIVAATLVVALQPTLVAIAGTGSEACSEKPYVVMIHADWCGTCRALESTWAQIRTELGDQATLLLLDVTNRTAFEESRAKAARLEIDEFFHEYRSRTGTIAVLDCKTRKPVAVVTGDRDLTTYRKAVARAARTS